MSAAQNAVTRRVGRRRCWDGRRVVGRWCRRQLGERPVELSEGLSDVADGESGVDATKPSLGCVGVVVQDADYAGKIIFAAAFLRQFPR